jgi:Berberine and berberine like
VVTAFEFAPHPVGTAALVVDRFFAPEDAAGPLRRWRELIADAPPQATLTAWVGTAAELPFLPPELHGRPLASVGYVWVGDPDRGRKLLPALRDGTPAKAERVQELSYLELQTMNDQGQRPGLLRRYWKGHYLRDLDDGAIGAFLSRGDPDGDPALLPSGTLQGYGGAIAAVGAGETAFGHREALVEFVADAGWADPAEDRPRMAAARRYGARVEPFASGIYVNDLTDEGEVGVRRAYGAGTLERLAALKDRYDPDNLFHLNHNIRPSKEQAR